MLTEEGVRTGDCVCPMSHVHLRIPGTGVSHNRASLGLGVSGLIPITSRKPFKTQYLLRITGKSLWTGAVDNCSSRCSGSPGRIVVQSQSVPRASRALK